MGMFNLTDIMLKGYRFMDNLQNHFLSPVEKELYVLGERYLLDYIKTGISNKSYCILTNERIYISGRYYTKEDGYKMPQKDNMSLSLDVIRLVNRRKKPILMYFILMLIGFLSSALLVPSVIFGLYAVSRHWSSSYFVPLIYLALAIALPIIGVLLYMTGKRELIIIEYDQGEIGLPAKLFITKEIQDFISKLQLARDEVLFEKTKVDYNVKVRDYNSVALELEKYKSLYDNGAIDETEYQILKSRLIQLPGRF